MTGDTAIRTRAPSAGLFEVRGELDGGLLQEAVRVVAGRHDILRGGTGAGAAWVSVPLVDVSGLGPGEQDREIGRLVARETAQLSALATPPPVRVSLVRRAPGRHVLAVTAHALVMDRTSIGLFAHEVARAYASADTGEPGPASGSYAGFAAHRREWLATRAAARDLDHWRQRLSDLPDLSLPADRGRPRGHAHPMAGHRWQVPSTLTARLRAVAEVDEVDDVLLAAWLAVLSRYGGQRDLAVGLPLPGRPDGWAGALGPFENTVVLRADLTGDPTFAALVDQVGRARRQAEEHGATPFEQLVDELRPLPDAPPLFQVRFLHERPTPPATYGVLEWRELDTTVPPSATALTLRLTTTPEGDLSVRLDYASDLFDTTTAERLLTHLRTLTEAATEQPGRVLSALPMLTPAEQARLTRDWPEGPPADGEPRLVHRMIEERAAEHPDAVAVVAGEDKLTYGALDGRANGLAHRLRELGAGPEKRVGVIADRTTHTVVALLAVLKAGAAYVPLDPDHPPERQQFILADAGIEVLLAHTHHPQAAPDGTTVIQVDTFEGESTDPDVPVRPDNLAYVIYTSGSTGTPKGVLVTHGNLACATAARWSCGRSNPGIYCLPVPFTFDGAAAGLYWTLAAGGRLVLPDAMTVHDPRRLGRLINLECATHFDAVPSQYEVLLSLCPRDLRSLRDISVGGEVLPPHVVAQHATMLPSATLYNDYGPTEATVWSTFHPCPTDFAGPTVPIGRPIPGARVLILDEDLNPLPQGIPGHLHIGGTGITRGYLNRPALTAQHYTPDPHHPGQRLYHTGDRARWLPDGTIEFLGRTDTQTKIRGYRIELGEIETTLQNHPAVTNAVVTTRHDAATGDPRLTAYVIAGDVGREELNTHLLASLPHYMLPATYVFLDKLPLTPHGKVDRQTLPSPDTVLDNGSARREHPPTGPGQAVAGMGDDEVDALLNSLMKGARK